MTVINITKARLSCIHIRCTKYWGHWYGIDLYRVQCLFLVQKLQLGPSHHMLRLLCLQYQHSI